MRIRSSPFLNSLNDNKYVASSAKQHRGKTPDNYIKSTKKQVDATTKHAKQSAAHFGLEYLNIIYIS